MARRQVEELQAALAEAEGREAAMAAELAELRQQAENAEVAAQNPANPQARIPTVRTHLPETFFRGTQVRSRTIPRRCEVIL